VKDSIRKVKSVNVIKENKSFRPLYLMVAVAAILFGSSATTYQQTSTSSSLTVTMDHVALNVADLDASVAFYSGVFGFQEIPAAAKGRRWLSLGKGVALHLLGGRSQPVADNRSVHLALTSDNLEPILQRLRERKITWSDFAGTAGAISTGRSDGVRQIFLRDPDGYWIEVNDALKKQ
jgi:catechol 2,3-dioxygenase-like lactoylglutathione lyase family enzyme